MNKIDKIKKEIFKKIKEKTVDAFDFNMSQEQSNEIMKQNIRNTLYEIYGEENISKLDIVVDENNVAKVNLSLVDNEKTRRFIELAEEKGLTK